MLWVWGLDSLPLFDWDEINFAEIAREMRRRGDYLQPTVDFLPFHEKPPLFAWLQALSFSLLGGPTSLAARLPNVVCGVVTLLILTRQPHGGWWAAFLGLSLLPGLYFRSGIIDPWFNLFILLALLPLFRRAPLTLRAGAGSALALGLAILTKGPVAALVVGLVGLGLLVARPERRGRRALRYALIGLLALLPPLLWLLLLWREDGGFFAREFLVYQWRLFVREDAGHGGFFGYHAIVLLLGCFPASVFALPALLRRRSFATPLDVGMRLLFWTVLILFSLVSTKIVHYSSLAYFPLAWFAARSVTARPAGEAAPVWLRRALTGVGILYGAAALVVATVGRELPDLAFRLADPALISRLTLPVAWPWYTFLPALVVLVGLGAGAYRRPALRRLAALSLATTLAFSLAATAVFAPRIQRYTQGAAVDFFRALPAGKAYVGTAYYKSYVPQFYAARTQVQGGITREQKFHGPLPYPLYFSSPLERTARVLREVPDAELLYQRGGFSFFRRPAVGDR